MDLDLCVIGVGTETPEKNPETCKDGALHEISTKQISPTS